MIVNGNGLDPGYDEIQDTILGVCTMSADLLQKQKELQEKKDELLSRLEAIQKDYRSGLSADSEEQAIQLENAEVLEEISRVTNEELQKVSQALDRIELQLKQ
ncbi:MAG TPA: hypothetical protein DCL78_13585 [Gammaproteobacteria bacterium]|jgi:phage shock protein A|nr:hypothetical protein [Gammaproteobacteria bacterium]HAU15376.1 hypothetical protein [Gammaproteobacteria bacterium]|tara:strand:+ start:30327 stop:30635 length:309 start_codon:yes stop_codon:yes gene_type:complete